MAAEGHIIRTKGDASKKAVGDRPALELVTVPTAAPVADQPNVSLYEQAEDLPLLNGANQEFVGDIRVLRPIDDPKKMYQAYRLSPIVQPVISAIVANAYASGYVLKPRVNPDRPEGARTIREALEYRAARKGISLQAWFEDDVEVASSDIEDEINRIRRRISRERQYVDAFFSGCALGGFTYLTNLLGTDVEVGGRGYLEVIRHGSSGVPVQLVWAPGWSIRPLPQQEQIAVPVKRMVSDIHWEERLEVARFRGFVQLDAVNNVIGRFKQFGDPRVLSTYTGRYYNTLDEMLANKDEKFTLRKDDGSDVTAIAKPATELLEFKNPSSTHEAFGKPSWTGAYPGAVGTRDLDEYNKDVVTDQVIPQMFLFVAGGAKITSEDIKSLLEQIKQQKETDGAAGLYILQAHVQTGEGDTPTSDPKIHPVKTKSEQHTDALGLSYKKDAYADIRRAYRMPKVALGDAEGINKATADYMSRFTEAQVYDPKRDIFSEPFQELLHAMGVELMTIHMKSRQPKEPRELSEIILNLVRAGVLTPDEARRFASDVFNRELPEIIGLWSKIPKELVTAILQTKNQLIAAVLLEEAETDVMSRLQEAFTGDMARRSDQGDSNNGPAGNPGGEGEPPQQEEPQAGT